jgi:hypothetical protein
MKRVLITAGCVYGALDDNKLVGNRIRGIWATRFATWLAGRGYDVSLLLPDTFPKSDIEGIRNDLKQPLRLLQQTGYESYAKQCYELAPKMDIAVLAAAVVNWIPLNPIKGKMKTEGFKEGDVQNIPFVLAPRVIDRMRKLNPKLTLVGCKMTSGAERADTLRAAYHTLLTAHCNVVVANDLSNLKKKLLVYPDGNSVVMHSFDVMYEDLEELMCDEFYRTEPHDTARGLPSSSSVEDARVVFDGLCTKYRDRFIKRPEGPNSPDRVFGAIAVRIDADSVLVSPREKGNMFSSQDAVIVTGVDHKRHIVRTAGGKKATLNAPLLLNVMRRSATRFVMHLHENLEGCPTYSYAPPGTVRDNDRSFDTSNFNILGHGCVFVRDAA